MNGIERVLLSMPDKYRLLLLVLAMVPVIIISAYLTTDTGTTWLITGAIMAVLFLTRPIWLPPDHGITQIRKLSIQFSVLLLVATQNLWRHPLTALSHDWSSSLPPEWQSRILPLEAILTGLVIVLAVLVIFAVNYFMRPNLVMGHKKTPLEEEFPEKTYKQELEQFCHVLREDLNKLDRETNWSYQYFTPLSAEVEIITNDVRRKRIEPLLTAMRRQTTRNTQDNNTNQVYQVLGDPGSGKSVSLRKLCRELLDEVNASGKVPVYINLRDWTTTNEWTETTPPNTRVLYDFVEKNLKTRLNSYFADDFINKYFRKMYDNGRLFLILDSFDEIPCVLDKSETSWLIDSLSQTIYAFLANGPDSRGILSSRLFRRPTRAFRSSVILEIRPFSEWQINQLLVNYFGQDQALMKAWLRENPDLISIARNPFSATLIVDYAKDHQMQAPANQAELYAEYIEKRLQKCQERLTEADLSITDIKKCAEGIAHLMLDTQELGLEAPRAFLINNLTSHPRDKVEKVIALLKYAGLGRLGSETDPRFSFCHRRFNEYFVVQKFIADPFLIKLDAIPSDSRWRDALTLYAEVAAIDKAKEIANFCWEEVKRAESVKMEDETYRRAVHSLRFLKDAFRARTAPLIDFRDALADFIARQIASGDPIAAKIGVEATGLLPQERINPILLQALDMQNTLISATVLKSCRHIGQIDMAMQGKLMDYVGGLNRWQLFVDRKEFLFSLKLANNLRFLYDFSKARIIDTFLATVGMLISCTSFIAVLFYLSVMIKQKLHGELFSNKTFDYFRMILLSFVICMFTITEQVWIAPSLDVFYHMANIDRKILFVFMFIMITISVPFYYMYILITNHSVYLVRKSKETRRRMLFVVLYVLVLGSLGVLIAHIATLLPEWARISVVILWLTVSLILGFWYIVGETSQILNERRQLESLTRRMSFDRTEIAEYFLRFQSTSNRQKFVEHLQLREVRVTGEWPEGRCPSRRNDPATSVLMQLEEHWRGLDR
ncbi:MAG: NACHT domain-containing protein [Magnetococcus sp. DMHC-8]